MAHFARRIHLDLSSYLSALEAAMRQIMATIAGMTAMAAIML